MRSFTCSGCGQLLFFENSTCLRCGRPVGFVTDRWTLITLNPADSSRYEPCANLEIAACNWRVEAGVATGNTARTLCVACALTRGRPADRDSDALVAFAEAETAKRRLLYQLHDLGLPIVDRTTDPEGGLAFDLLSSRDEPVTTGHADGVITLDLAESDDAHRTQVQQQLGEPYRTLLGHFRHEIGHYYWTILVEQHPERLADCRAAFGDDTADYADAVDHHYAAGPPPGWEDAFVSAYATMHPWEDWAETFAHYLHIRDTLQTAAAFRIRVAGPPAGGAERPGELATALTEQTGQRSITDLLNDWLPLTYALNAVNRSMGKEDLYPFVLAPMVIAKLTVVHDLVGSLRP